MTEADHLTEKEKMLAGLPYMAHDRELDAERLKARDLCLELNLTPSSEKEKRDALARRIFGKAGRNLGLVSPLMCDYGKNIVIGNDCFINANCVLLDCAKITLGDGVLIAPNVALYTAEHPLEPVARRRGIETARPITIGSNVWIGGNTVILPGVTIGGNSVIGAGSVVTKNIPANVLAYGNPCRIIKKIC